MTNSGKSKWFRLIVLLGVLACAGSWATGEVHSMRDRSKVAKATEKMRSVCAGRFLVDVPVQAEVSFSWEMIDGFDVETVQESERDFQARVAAREAAIAAQGTTAEGKGGMVEARDIHAAGMVGRTFIFGRYHSYGIEEGRRVDIEWVSVEAYAHRDGLSASLSMKLANEDDAKAAEALLSRLRTRGEDEIPAVPGFCVHHAVFAEPLPLHQTEHIVMHIGLPDHPDLGMIFSSLPGGGRTRSLLTRVNENDAQASADEMLRVTKLRTGKRNINTVHGEEVLERVREFNFATTFGFMWETQGVKDDILKPFLSLELQAGSSLAPGGKPAGSSLHQDAVLALWDSISSSIRLRSGEPPAKLPGRGAARLTNASRTQ